MGSELDMIELEEFNNLVDNIIKDIQEGRLKANPLNTEEKATVNEIAQEELIIEDTETETGETKNIVVPEVIGSKLGNKMVEIKNAETGEYIAIYSSAATAEKYEGIHQTTVRNYCTKYNTEADAEGRLWNYITKEDLYKGKA